MGEASMSAKLLAEFAGTFALVFSVGLNVCGGSGPFNVVSIASTLMVMIYALGGVSGGHFNPAVSFAIGLVGGADWGTLGMYMATQILGGCLAVASYCSMFDAKAPHPGVPHNSALSMLLGEFFYTFMLVFTVLNVAVARRSAKNEYFGIAIAFTVVAGGYGAGAWSGGFFNPAIVLSVDFITRAFVSGSGNFMSLGFAGIQFLAGLVAFVMFRVVHPEEGSDADEETPLGSKVVSEFLGTFFLVLTVGLNVGHGGGPSAAFSIASSLMCMIYALGNVSGAHFNPAVTIAILLSGRDKISASDAGVYIGTQLLAGVVAGAVAGLMCTPLGGAATGLSPIGPHSWLSCAGAEIWYTFVLAFVVLSVATTSSPLAQFFALAIGFCVVVGGYSVGGISGGHLNPAVSFGVATGGAMNGGGGAWWKCLPYFGFQAAGGALASTIFSMTHAGEYEKSVRLGLASKGHYSSI
jgi:aquaporin Z